MENQNFGISPHPHPRVSLFPPLHPARLSSIPLRPIACGVASHRLSFEQCRLGTPSLVYSKSRICVFLYIPFPFPSIPYLVYFCVSNSISRIWLVAVNVTALINLPNPTMTARRWKERIPNTQSE
ncbi:hypothetical protein I3843_09G161100 [Carya illinoinensis]|uniref:Uncharacterized protein n=1 Tax=Carya illinoinensis TaxID=32201 RepID=A0A922J6R0_CARIL|nr:hypothetical protein I3842_09G166000 [Carya illinoinensis]KAG7964254.1 hypothetical protein I3843_09G161100 [Carya illinoinensis]